MAGVATVISAIMLAGRELRAAAVDRVARFIILERLLWCHPVCGQTGPDLAVAAGTVSWALGPTLIRLRPMAAMLGLAAMEVRFATWE